MIREVKNTPKQLIHNGDFQTGAFKDYFQDLNITQYNHRTLINRETLWQAVEIDHPKYFVICAVYKYQLFHKSLFLVYDKETYQLYDYSSEGVFYKSYVSKSLINGETSSRTTKESRIEIINLLDQNRIILKANYKKEFSIEADLLRKASPSVVSIPMSRKHVVYTEKDYFVCNGTMIFEDIKINLDEDVFAVLDDHRGYYPLNSGYDWISGFGRIKFLQENSHVVLNLTDFHRNLDNELYCENGLFFHTDYLQLSPVVVKRANNEWEVTSKDHSADLKFYKKNQYQLRKKGLLQVDYEMAFGEIKGHIYIQNTKVPVRMFAVGEKRVTKFGLFKKM